VRYLNSSNSTVKSTLELLSALGDMFLSKIFLGGLRRVAITTGTRRNANTKGKVMMKVCDKQNNCCETGSNGLRNGRGKGDRDIYNGDNLGSCNLVSLAVKLETR